MNQTTDPINKQDPATIKEMFSSIASQYDRGNAILSLGLHRRWNSTLVNQVLIPEPPTKYLDLCCGTGEIAFTYLKNCQGVRPPPEATYLLDFSGQMLSEAEKKASRLGVDDHNLIYLQADAQQIPLPDQSIDRVTIAYGIRNVKDTKSCIQEIYRVLKPGGKVGILELTRPKNPFMRVGHQAYLKLFVPTVGRLFTANGKAYSYLQKSIGSYMPMDILANHLADSQFGSIEQTSLLGGTATITIAVK